MSMSTGLEIVSRGSSSRLPQASGLAAGEGGPVAESRPLWSGSRTPEGSRGTERVFEKLDVVNFPVSHLREEREGRSDFLAGLAPAIRERAEHRDLVVLNQDLTDLESLGLPRPPDPFEGAYDGFGPFVRPGPGQIALELRVVLVERDIGYVRGRHAFHIGQIARVGDQRLEDLCG